MYIRNYQKSDLKDIIFLFRETVHNINSKDYTQEQVKIWAPENIDEKSGSSGIPVGKKCRFPL